MLNYYFWIRTKKKIQSIMTESDYITPSKILWSCIKRYFVWSLKPFIIAICLMWPIAMWFVATTIKCCPDASMQIEYKTNTQPVLFVEIQSSSKINSLQTNKLPIFCYTSRFNPIAQYAKKQYTSLFIFYIKPTHSTLY